MFMDIVAENDSVLQSINLCSLHKQVWNRSNSKSDFNGGFRNKCRCSKWLCFNILYCMTKSYKLMFSPNNIRNLSILQITQLTIVYIAREVHSYRAVISAIAHPIYIFSC